MTTTDVRPSRRPWLFFLAAAAWSVLVRVPLVMNAAGHLDSDLAVDGLTLLEATRGHWRWHYPGTPFIGSIPVLFSLPQAMVWGANPVTLVSGGGVAWVGLMLATFVLAWKAFKARVAIWALVPLAFASNGAVWLSGRITGGHLAAAVWHAGAFALLADGLGHVRGWKSWAALGAWCGVGMAVDSMFALTMLGIGSAAVGHWLASGSTRRGGVAAAVFLGAFAVGVSPRFVGERVDPYDAYRGQFALVTDPGLLLRHGRILAADCLPRLVAGHRLPGLESDPDPASISAPGARREPEAFDGLALLAVVLTLPLAVVASLGMAGAAVTAAEGASRAVAGGLVVSAGATVLAFLANRNIVNSDNYRYLVCLLVPWSVGFGVVMRALVRRGPGGVAVAAGVAVLLAGVMTADLVRWYARFGWVDQGRPVVKPVDDPGRQWLDAHPGVTWIDGGYWDVYRLSFLTGGRVRGKPFPIYPDRFPEWTPPADEKGRATVIRPSFEGAAFRDAAVRSGRRPVLQARGLTILGALTL